MMIPAPCTALLLLVPFAALALVADLEGSCEPGEACPSDFDSLLQLRLDVQPVQPPAPAAKPSNYFDQRLYNAADLQYSGDVILGGQRLRAVLDTGSFELLAFGKGCQTCGTARQYDYLQSKTYVTGSLQTTHSFGSGDCICLDGTDLLEIGPWHVEKQAFWEVVQTNMAVLQSASFHAILGLAPPGEPQKQAMELLQTGLSVNEQIAELVLAKNDSVLMNMNVNVFSACFEWHQGAPGHLVWNDLPPSLQPVPFVEMPVVSEIYWHVRMTSPRLGVKGNKSLGCANGCKALLDTGTSLLTAPQAVFIQLLAQLQGLDKDCINLSQMPDLVFELGGHTHSLPPSAYIGVVEGPLSSEVQGFMPSPTPGMSCQLLLMNGGPTLSGQEELWILGMPFFRHYYTTFDLGAHPYNVSSRRVWTAHASSDCQPRGEAQRLSGNTWRVNGTLIRPPKRWHRVTGSFDSEGGPAVPHLRSQN